MRTRKFRARNEVRERSSDQESKGKKASVDKKVGQCSKGDSCSFSHERATGNTVAELRDEKDNRPHPHQIRRPRLMARDENAQKNQATEEKALQTKGDAFRADTEHVITRHVIIGIHPCVKMTSLRQDACMARGAIFDMLRQRRSPARSQRKVVQRISCHVEGVYTTGLCVSRFLSETVYST